MGGAGVYYVNNSFVMRRMLNNKHIFNVSWLAMRDIRPVH